MNDKTRLLCFDIEVFEEDWVIVIQDIASGKKCIVVNDRDKLIRVYNKYKNAVWCGYNNKHYDQFIFKSIIMGMNPKEVSDKLIVNGIKGYQISKEFKNIPMYNYDCMLLNTGLKQLEGFMGESIQETSVDFNIDRKLTEKELQESINYCIHDVEQTIKVFEATKSDFEAHIGMISEFNLDMMDFNKTKAQLSAKVLNAERVHGVHDEMDYEFVDCIKLDKYKHVMEWFDKNRTYKVINEKGKEVKNQLKVNVGGLETVFGFGGVHSAIKKYKGDGFIIHSDVNSYYPYAMVNFNLLSRGVKEPQLYQNILDTRMEMKKKKDPRQAPYKIILNATFGILKDQFNPMFDPKKSNEVCINCQLLLLDLVEKLECEFEEDILTIQLNTDGIIMKLKDESLYERYIEICKEWESRTGFGLGHDMIKRIIQKDVNNYIFEFENGKLERKGSYVKKLSKIDYDLPIVNKALVEYFINDTPIEETINNCDELIEFQKISKIGSTYKHITYGDKKINEKVVRTFACKKDLPGVFKAKDKINKDGIQLEVLEKIANTPEKCFIENGNIIGVKCPDYLDKQYYIDMANKRVEDYLGKGKK